jgi:alcohol dehydrogenase
MKNDSQLPFVFDEPTKIIYGQGAIHKITEELDALGAKSVVIVCDRGLVESGVIRKIETILSQQGDYTVSLFDGIIPNPLDTTIDEGCRFALDHDADCIIGVGGGSSLDSAKAIAMLAANGGAMRDYLMEGKQLEKPILDTLCVPTTAGTGSEVTRTVVATDSRTKFKEGFKDVNRLVAKAAIIDPELMATLPAHIFAACGMDALTHAIESYTSWKGNPFTDALNSHAIFLIGSTIRKAYADPADMDAKGKMLLASAMTGVAFDQSGLGLAHVLGHPMGGLFNVPHGFACAMALPVAMEYNMIAVPEKYTSIAQFLGEPYGSGNGIENGMKAVAAVRSLMADLGIPSTLEDVGVSEKDIPAMVKDALGFPGMIGANPRAAGAGEIEILYRKLL